MYEKGYPPVRPRRPTPHRQQTDQKFTLHRMAKNRSVCSRCGVGLTVWLVLYQHPTPVLPCPFPFLLVFESDGDFDHRWYEKGIDEEDFVLL